MDILRWLLCRLRQSGLPTGLCFLFTLIFEAHYFYILNKNPVKLSILDLFKLKSRAEALLINIYLFLALLGFINSQKNFSFPGKACIFISMEYVSGTGPDNGLHIGDRIHSK